MGESQATLYRRYKSAIASESLPLAAIDLEAFDANVARLLEPVRAAKKTLRIATKSLRVVELIRRAARLGEGVAKGFMTFSTNETAMLADEGLDDFLLAYPVARTGEARAIAELSRRANVRVVIDSDEHRTLLESAAEAVGARLPIVIDVDASYRKGSLHLGVKRSPLHTPKAIAELAARVADSKHLSFAGLMAYEAQIAGLGDDDPRAPLTAPVKRLVKQLSRAQLLTLRADVVREIGSRGLAIPLFNGGGTGSVPWSSTDASLTEVTAGSGFFDAHLFDHYRDVSLTPAAFFALAVTRRPSPDVVTCAFGGYVASGGVGPDRAPVPWLPEGLSLLPREGAGEVQTPVAIPRGLRFELGDPIFFRHAKAGELCERFSEVLLVRGDRVESRAKTYRGMGHAFG